MSDRDVLSALADLYALVRRVGGYLDQADQDVVRRAQTVLVATGRIAETRKEWQDR